LHCNYQLYIFDANNIDIFMEINIERKSDERASFMVRMSKEFHEEAKKRAASLGLTLNAYVIMRIRLDMPAKEITP